MAKQETLPEEGFEGPVIPASDRTFRISVGKETTKPRPGKDPETRLTVTLIDRDHGLEFATICGRLVKLSRGKTEWLARGGKVEHRPAPSTSDVALPAVLAILHGDRDLQLLVDADVELTIIEGELPLEDGE